jgi:alkylated DNA nucleotide flippase Atl1
MEEFKFDLDKKNYEEIKSEVSNRVVIRKYNDGFVEIYLDGEEVGTPSIARAVGTALIQAATDHELPPLWRAR